MRPRRLAGLALAIALAAPAAASPETETARLFDSLVGEPARLRVFLKAMPKGADLHNHLSGSPYAEDYLAWAAERGWCVETAKMALVPPPCTGEDRVPAAGLGVRDNPLYQSMVDALSIRGHAAGVGANERSGHDAMFGSFGHFGALARLESARSLVAVRRMAAGDHVSYVEVMFNPPSAGAFAGTTHDPAWRDDDFAAAFDRVKPLLPALIDKARAETDQLESEARQRLDCRARTEPACAVETRFVAFGARSLPPPQLFRQLALLFALAAQDPRYVGVNLVEPEDWPTPTANYAQTMRMIAFLSERYPTVHRTLHAGELAPGLVPPAALANHIAQAVTVARAQRIGHGTDIASEVDARGTLARMARDRVAVEVNLISNDRILGVRGAEHPLTLYRAAGVPVSLATDDEGVLRTDMTEQYVRAATGHGLRYADLKTIARNGLEYAFLPGPSLWQDGAVGTPVPACTDPTARACTAFLAASDKARRQQALEEQFATFEKAIVASRF